MPGWVVRTPQKMWEGSMRVSYDEHHTAEVTPIAPALGRSRQPAAKSEMPDWRGCEKAAPNFSR
jgi:hypothetical protein